jgi:hypothetical protein
VAVVGSCLGRAVEGDCRGRLAWAVAVGGCRGRSPWAAAVGSNRGQQSWAVGVGLGGYSASSSSGGGSAAAAGLRVREMLATPCQRRKVKSSQGRSGQVKSSEGDARTPLPYKEGVVGGHVYIRGGGGSGEVGRWARGV